MATYRIVKVSGEERKATIEVHGIPIGQVNAKEFVIFKVAEEFCSPEVMEDISKTVGELCRRGMLPAGKKALVLPAWIEACEFVEEKPGQQDILKNRMGNL